MMLRCLRIAIRLSVFLSYIPFDRESIRTERMSGDQPRSLILNLSLFSPSFSTLKPPKKVSALGIRTADWMNSFIKCLLLVRRAKK
ncbi:MAG: hypothetical protein A4E61_00630 [Syntrophorhabdus sp. PtaB.Bin184]|nr:MAG: hypothetical protein A4E61_00630 [Syntrophorhabdus sp. PtaB.Bin184]